MQGESMKMKDYCSFGLSCGSGSHLELETPVFSAHIVVLNPVLSSVRSPLQYLPFRSFPFSQARCLCWPHLALYLCNRQVVLCPSTFQFIHNEVASILARLCQSIGGKHWICVGRSISMFSKPLITPHWMGARGCRSLVFWCSFRVLCSITSEP